MELLPLRAAFVANQTDTLAVLLQIDPPSPELRDRPALDLSLVIDRSGSMGGAPMQAAVQAACQAVSSLSESDRVAVVAFDNIIEVPVALQNPQDKPGILEKIRSIGARGSTALHSGWLQGAKELSAGDGSRLRRVVLLTDGEANVGLVAPDAIATQVREAADRGIQTTTLGFGQSYNENLLKAMAASGNGNHYYVERSGQLADFFNLELAGMESTVGTSVELSAEPVPEVKVHVLQDLPILEGGGWRLADLMAGSPFRLLLQVDVPAWPPGIRTLAKLRLSWSVPGQRKRVKKNFKLVLPALEHAQWSKVPEEPRVREQVGLRVATLAQAEASKALTSGNKAAATEHLTKALDSLVPLKGSQAVMLTQRLKAQLEQVKAGQTSAASKSMTIDSYSSMGSVVLSGFFKPQARARHLNRLISEGTWPLKGAVSPNLGWLLTMIKEEAQRERLRGMLLGLAVGDALGASTKGQEPEQRRSSYGEVRDFISSRGTRSGGQPSDITQLTFWSLETMTELGDFIPEGVAEALAKRPLESGGQALRGSMESLRQGLTWEQAGVASAGNGALARSAAVVTTRLYQGNALLLEAALFAGLTHRDNAALTSALAISHMLLELLRREQPPEAAWWWERYVELASPFETDQTYSVRGVQQGWTGTLSQFVSQVVPEACARDLSVEEACRSWRSGSYLFETVPSALYILARHSGSLEEAVIRAVNDTVDSPAIAALVGSALGALYGAQAIPHRWLDECDFRTSADDKGAVLRIVDQALNLFLAKRI